MCFTDNAPETVYREMQELDALLREFEHRRRRLLREIAAVRLWQWARNSSEVAHWISKLTLQQRSKELASVERRIARLIEQMNVIISRFPGNASLVPDKRQYDVSTSTVSLVFLQKPFSRCGG